MTRKSLAGLTVGRYMSWRTVCEDGYSLSKTPVFGFEMGEVLAKVDEHVPLTSRDGSFASEILKTIFNIGLEDTDQTPLWIIPNSLRYRRYDPVNQPVTGAVQEAESTDFTIHREFAGLAEKDDDAILKFANEYGLLSYHAAHRMVFKKRHAGPQFQLGESLLWWKEEIKDLAECVRLWDMVMSRNKKLRQIVLWHQGGVTVRLGDQQMPIVGRANMNVSRTWRKGSVREPVLYYLSVEADKRLHNSLTPAPTWRGQVSFRPANLLATIWLMFVLEMSGKSKLVRCASCGEYFGSEDPRARFCSARCRMRNYRSRVAG